VLHGSCVLTIGREREQMGLLFVPLLLATLLCQQSGASYLQKPATATSNPAFVWGSLPVLKQGDEASRVIYEVSS